MKKTLSIAILLISLGSNASILDNLNISPELKTVAKNLGNIEFSKGYSDPYYGPYEGLGCAELESALAERQIESEEAQLRFEEVHAEVQAQIEETEKNEAKIDGMFDHWKTRQITKSIIESLDFFELMPFDVDQSLLFHAHALKTGLKTDQYVIERLKVDIRNKCN